MPSVSGELARAVYHVKRVIDRRKLRWKRRLGWLEPVIILPYRSYGTSDCLTVRGRVVEDRELDKVGAGSSPWRNLLHTFRLYHTRVGCAPSTSVMSPRQGGTRKFTRSPTTCRRAA